MNEKKSQHFLPAMHILIKGNVQGVCFRITTKHLADQLGIKGYVRNLSNGCVEICVTSGDAQKLIKQLEQEPPPIRIDGIETRKISLSDRYSSFEIKQ